MRFHQVIRQVFQSTTELFEQCTDDVLQVLIVVPLLLIVVVDERNADTLDESAFASDVFYDV